MKGRPTRDDLQFQLETMEASALLLDGLDSACIGFTYSGANCIAVYDESLCIQALQTQGMDREEAIEYYDFNVTGSFMGAGTPLFITPVEVLNRGH